MGKIRLYELAQRLGADSKTLIERFARLGVEVKSHMSMLEEKDVQKIRPLAASEGEHYDEKRVSQGIIRRRRKDPAPAETVPAEMPLPKRRLPLKTAGNPSLKMALPRLSPRPPKRLKPHRRNFQNHLPRLSRPMFPRHPERL